MEFYTVNNFIGSNLHMICSIIRTAVNYKRSLVDARIGVDLGIPKICTRGIAHLIAGCIFDLGHRHIKTIAVCQSTNQRGSIRIICVGHLCSLQSRRLSRCCRCQCIHTVHNSHLQQHGDRQQSRYCFFHKLCPSIFTLSDICPSVCTNEYTIFAAFSQLKITICNIFQLSATLSKKKHQRQEYVPLVFYKVI